MVVNKMLGSLIPASYSGWPLLLFWNVLLCWIPPYFPMKRTFWPKATIQCLFKFIVTDIFRWTFKWERTLNMNRTSGASSKANCACSQHYEMRQAIRFKPNWDILALAVWVLPEKFDLFSFPQSMIFKKKKKNALISTLSIKYYASFDFWWLWCNCSLLLLLFLLLLE